MIHPEYIPRILLTRPRLAWVWVLYLALCLTLPPAARAQSPASADKQAIPRHAFWSAAVLECPPGILRPWPLMVRCVPRGLEISAGDAPENEPPTVLKVGAMNLTVHETRLAGYSDWMVDLLQQGNNRALGARLVMGSPFFYLTFHNSQPWILLDAAPADFSSLDGSPVPEKSLRGEGYTGDTLRFTAGNHTFALFTPRGTRYLLEGSGERLLLTLPEGSNWLTGCLLPRLKNAASLNAAHQFFYQYAFAWPSRSQISWNINLPASRVTMDFHLETESRQYFQNNSLLGLFPHHTRGLTTEVEFPGYEYTTGRGTLQMHPGNHFAVAIPLAGLLPFLPLPDHASFDHEILKSLMETALDKRDTEPEPRGAIQAPWASLMPVAWLLGDTLLMDRMIVRLREEVDAWLARENDEKLAETMGEGLRNAALLVWADPAQAGAYLPRIEGMLSDVTRPLLDGLNLYGGRPFRNATGNGERSLAMARGMALWGALTGHAALEDRALMLYSLEHFAGDAPQRDPSQQEQAAAPALAYLDQQQRLQFGIPDDSVRADTPYYQVFRHDSGKVSHMAFNPSARTREVTFTDGSRRTVPPRSLSSTVGWSAPAAEGASLLLPEAGHDDTHPPHPRLPDLPPPDFAAPPVCPPVVFDETFLGGGSSVVKQGTAQAELDLQDAAFPFTGKQAMCFRFQIQNPESTVRAEWYHGAEAEAPGVDLRHYQQLEMYLKASAQVTVRVGIGHPEQESGHKQMPVTLETGYRKVRLDLTRLNRGDLSRINTLLFLEARPEDNSHEVLHHEVWIDEVRFVGGTSNPPQAPSGLAFDVALPGQVRLTWQASASPHLAGYRIYRDQQLIKTVSGTETLDSGLTPGRHARYQVSAYTIHGLESALSTAILAALPDPASGKPNLILDAMIPDGASPLDGTPVFFNISVTNRGQSPTPEAIPLEVSLEVNGQFLTLCSWHHPVSPGETITLSTRDSGIPWVPAAGSFTLRATVDPAAKIPGNPAAGNTLETFWEIRPAATMFPPLLYEDQFYGGGTQVYYYHMQEAVLDMDHAADAFQGNRSMEFRVRSLERDGRARFGFYFGPDVHAEGFNLEPFNFLHLALKASRPLTVHLRVGDSIFDSGYLDQKVKVTETWRPILLDLKSPRHGTLRAVNSLLVVDVLAEENDGVLDHRIHLDAVRLEGPTLRTFPSPENLTGSLREGAVVALQWKSPPGVQVAGYKIYRNGHYLMSTPEPQALDLQAPSGLILLYQVSAFDISGAESAKSEAHEIHVPLLLPDLEIQDIQVGPKNLQEGDGALFRVTLLNSGSGTASDAALEISLWINGVFQGRHPVPGPLKAGESATVTVSSQEFGWTATPGRHTVRVFADPYQKIRESDKTNNHREQAFYCQPFNRFPPVLSGTTFNGGGIEAYGTFAEAAMEVVTGTFQDRERAILRMSVQGARVDATARFECYSGPDLSAEGMDLRPYNRLVFEARASASCLVWLRVGDAFHDSGYRQVLAEFTENWQPFTIPLQPLDAGTPANINTLFSVTIQAADQEKPELDLVLEVSSLRFQS